MYKNVIVFVVCFALAFGGGYLFYSAKALKEEVHAQKHEAANVDPVKEKTTGAASKEGEIFSTRGCITCHSISALNVKGGQAGPDLSKAYANVEGKHGVKIEDFLKKPTSAVMSGVLGAKPLTDQELKAVIAALKIASEK